MNWDKQWAALEDYTPESSQKIVCIDVACIQNSSNHTSILVLKYTT